MENRASAKISYHDASANITHGLPLTALIHENCSIIVTFAFSQKPLIEWSSKNFVGEWEYVGKFCFEIPRTRATRAVLELATQLRLLDDQEKLSEYFRATQTDFRLGVVRKLNDKIKKLSFRAMANKIIHSAGIEWNFDPDKPILICHAHPDEKHKWVKAEVSITGLAGLCGRLAS
jgi:hypothetical protein